MIFGDEVWERLGWRPPRGFHLTRLDNIRLTSERDGGMDAVLECRIMETGVACGHCHHCGSRLAFTEARSCQVCGSSDTDE